jgi:hypothetical protein
MCLNMMDFPFMIIYGHVKREYPMQCSYSIYPLNLYVYHCISINIAYYYIRCIHTTLQTPRIYLVKSQFSYFNK